MSSSPRPKVIVRRMGQPAVAPAAVDRKPGQRVGLTWSQILAAARRVLARHSGPISVKAVAQELGVAHNSISSRLRRADTTLEQELAAEFLTAISRPMLPGETWQIYLQNMFGEALRLCEAHPGLARAVTPWLSQGPLLCPDFTERLLHLLVTAGLPQSASEDHVDTVTAALCGMLSVRFPEFGRDPRSWATTIAHGLEEVTERQHPLLHRSRKALSDIAKQKAVGLRPARSSRPSGTAVMAADLLVLRIKANLK